MRYAKNLPHLVTLTSHPSLTALYLQVCIMVFP